jgi:hypothetical protein
MVEIQAQRGIFILLTAVSGAPSKARHSGATETRDICRGRRSTSVKHPH